jgi:regulator of sigma E protease
MITFSLGLLNLFPLPVLDGGHIVMAMIQIIIRRPLPAKLVEPLTMLFVVLLISFMLYVTAFDIKRVYNNRSASQTTDTIQTLSCKIKVN